MRIEFKRSIPDTFDAAIVKAIDSELAEIEQKNHATVAWAIESGSRAWGFPSPDSDYDCRFIYVRKTDEYLSPWPPRDVIELPVADDLDINGWDLGKALILLLKGNAVVIEWLKSPIIYRGDDWLRVALLSLFERHGSRDAVIRHYLHLGERQRNTYFADEKAVTVKKLFYALRPAAALRWFRINSGGITAPMHFPTLMAECDPPEPVAKLANLLIERKAATRELGTEPLPSILRDFVDNEFEITRSAVAAKGSKMTHSAREDANTLFRQAVERYSSNY